MPSSSDAAPALHGLAGYRDRHRGGTIVVCGCGPSARLLTEPGRCLTIGVNDIGRLYTPDYLVVVNERRQFAADRYVHVERSEAKAVFSQLALEHPRAVRFRLGRRSGTDRGDGQSLHYTGNSPYVAVQLARHMGAARIGLVGVDFDDAGHFFGRTGRHPLAGRLAQIDREYAALADGCRADGVELVNLSPASRLSSLPRARLEDWLPGAAPVAPAARRVFCVHYRFLSCGTVFDTGLREAAQSLGLAAEHADWDDAQLVAQIERFRPDLLFVVHGRRFAERHGTRFAHLKKAVWLLDEPYEVDDTARWSGRFDLVFVNDAASLARHRHAHELPVAYAPALHHGDPGAPRRHRVGFIGGANPTRERMLAALAERRLLDYVVGGPWHDARLNARCRSPNIPAEETAALYRETQIVVNVFRDRHHYNRERLPGGAMNPRIVEALACGALVISEPRSDLTRLVPELPTFETPEQAIALIERFLAHPDERLEVQRACAARLADATYAQRLSTVMDLVFDPPLPAVLPVAAPAPAEVPAAVFDIATMTSTAVVPFDDDWDDLGAVARRTTDGTIVVDPGTASGPGLERGLVGRLRYDAVDLSFEACLEPGSCLLAKVHQADRLDQTTNSYHLYADERRAYLARHQHVFRSLESPRLAWTRFRLQCRDGVLALWRGERLLHRVRDRALAGGYAFIGAQGGSVRLRALRIAAAAEPRSKPPPRDDEVETLRALTTEAAPRLSIVTTVYDRTECLARCIASVQRLQHADYEHLIVADHPPPEVLAEIRRIVAAAGDARIGLYDLKQRHNNWGIAPAAAGLRRARGEFVAFLSDDNGYLPDHFEPLIRTLDRDPALGFVYSSCQYDGRLVLSHPVPRPGRIDLGQPLFRRELFELHLDDDLPFDMMAWDWHLVDTLMRRGVRWRHVNRKSFIFRLAKYPQLMAA
ncbi:MAG: glycosyltransferase [Proteobacteria bacterium]|nr:glycosyltransferase [Pseudomonadota bacterium]